MHFLTPTLLFTLFFSASGVIAGTCTLPIPGFDSMPYGSCVEGTGSVEGGGKRDVKQYPCRGSAPCKAGGAPCRLVQERMNAIC